MHNFRFRILFYSIVSIGLALLIDVFVVGTLLTGFGGLLQRQTADQEAVVSGIEQTTPRERAAKDESLVENSGYHEVEVHRQKAHDQMLYRVLFTVCVVVAIFVGLGSFFLIFQVLSRPSSSYLREISDGIDEIALGEFRKEIPVRGEDEFANIAEKLNTMTKEIQMLLANERQYEREKDALITNVAHDLRTPLTSVIGYLDLVRMKEDLTKEELDRYINVAYDKAKRLEKLVEDLFEFTKVGAERIQVHFMEIDFKRFIEQMIEEFYPSFESAKLECIIEMNVERGMIFADGDLLARGISNLFSNAVKYGRDGKVLKVRVKENIEKNCMKLQIVNFGEIISQQDLEHIFDKFFRGESSRSTETGGSGLGLAIAKKVVLLHHGQIKVTSDYNGTVFSVSLPIVQHEEGKDETESEA